MHLVDNLAASPAFTKHVHNLDEKGFRRHIPAAAEFILKLYQYILNILVEAAQKIKPAEVIQAATQRRTLASAGRTARE